MRSDIQNTVDKIHASMRLIRQRIGWEAAHIKLDELNARTEDINLWNDPENAQKLCVKGKILVTQLMNINLWTIH